MKLRTLRVTDGTKHWTHLMLGLEDVPLYYSSNISNTKQCFIGISNTEKRVENMTRSTVFLTKFKVFG